MPSMMLTLFSLTLLTLSPGASAQDHPERSVVVESSASLANVGGHGRIEKNSHVGGAARMKLEGAGITMMEGVSLGEKSSASLVRREPKHEKLASVGASLAEHSTSDQKVLGDNMGKSKGRAVTWSACAGGSCQCATAGNMTSVIRYARQYDSIGAPVINNLMTNWHYRTHTRPYTNTSVEEFSKGFTTNATDLHVCGGDVAFSKDCVVAPTACDFDTTDWNPYDAKTGEYCCSGTYQYCSYKCRADEVFKCPSLTIDSNFPGGMDPAGPDVPKTCMTSVYKQGMNPESSSDSDADSNSLAD